MRIFADTSGLYAAVVRADDHHETAARILERLIHDRSRIETTSYVLIETMALLQTRMGPQAATRFEDDMRPVLAVRWVDEDLHRRAVQRLKLRMGRGVSLVDCASFVAMEEAGIVHAFTFDSHFADEGFTLLEASRSK